VPPSKRDENVWVFMAALFIVLCVIYIVAFERYGGPASVVTAQGSKGLLPFQVLFRDLPSGEQRAFRQMQEGVVELMAMRGTREDWPPVDELRSQGIPPFAPDVLDKLRMQWTLDRDGLVYEYTGSPTASTLAPAYMIMIVEPDPQTGEKANPTVVDEEHQLLADGRLLHVTYWKHAPPYPSPGVAPDPARAGWMQIRVKTLFEEMKP
jgi:hypothetical protein